LATQNTDEIINFDHTLAMTISKKLGGLPLALGSVASFMLENAISMRKFLEIYSVQPDLTHRDFLDELENTRKRSFHELDLESRNAMGVLHFLSPDGIPLSLFEHGGRSDVPERLGWCSNCKT
jgi:hypothetical protein